MNSFLTTPGIGDPARSEATEPVGEDTEGRKEAWNKVGTKRYTDDGLIGNR